MEFNKGVAFSGLESESLTATQVKDLEEAAAQCKAMIIAMTSRANSGHPGGSISSLKLYMTAYLCSNLRPENACQMDRDYVAISHGHTSPAAYATLAYLGFFHPDAAISGFRTSCSLFAGHVEREILGIDWTSGNLGQGLSAAAGFALGQRARGYKGRVFVLLGDGEQTKGQLAEARRTITQQKLHNVVALIDDNDIQISGRTDDVMPCNTRALWEADGWTVLDVDGTDFAALYRAVKQADSIDAPVLLLAKTVMGEGVAFMEDKPDYHGKAVTGDLYKEAMEQLGQPDPLQNLSKAEEPAKKDCRHFDGGLPMGTARTYGVDEKTDCRGAFGKALTDVAALAVEENKPFLVFDCDLAGSTKTDGVAKNYPEHFLQMGIAEHNTAVVAGAASSLGVATVFAGFGMFGLDEAYNQQRLNDINETNLNLVLTHTGLDVGEDGKTHQCIDYISLLSGCMDWQLVCPADGNQADRATRWALSRGGNHCIAMGRSKLSILTNEAGEPALTGDFTYGEVIKLREGKDAAILALGPMAHQAVKTADLLKDQGVSCAVYLVSCPLEVCDDTLKELFSHAAVVTLEDHNLRGGMGALWLARACELGLQTAVERLGVHTWGCSAASTEVYRAMGLDSETIADKVLALLG